MKYKVEQITRAVSIEGVYEDDLKDIQTMMNDYAKDGWRLHSFSTAIDRSDRILAIMVFEQD